MVSQRFRNSIAAVSDMSRSRSLCRTRCLRVWTCICSPACRVTQLCAKAPYSAPMHSMRHKGTAADIRHNPRILRTRFVHKLFGVSSVGCYSGPAVLTSHVTCRPCREPKSTDCSLSAKMRILPAAMPATACVLSALSTAPGRSAAGMPALSTPALMTC